MLRDQEKNITDITEHTLKQKLKMGRTCSQNEGQKMDKTLYRVAAKEGEQMKGTIKQKTARRASKEGGNHLHQESNRQKIQEGIDGGLHPAVNGQSPGEM